MVRRIFPVIAALALSALLGACASTPMPAPTAAPLQAVPATTPVTWAQIAALAAPAPGLRIAYGADASQFGELRLPDGAGPHPVAVIVHGGCWQSEYDLAYMQHASAALTGAGIATWTLEFRRIGASGGGWPATFEDVAQGTEHLRSLADRHALDLQRVVFVGHSAGGHLALWLAARGKLPPQHPLHAEAPLRPKGVVTLAGITDLRAYGAGTGSCNQSVAPLLGGDSETVPERYAAASPIEMLPLGLPQRLVQGTLDPIVPLAQAESFSARARASGDDSQVLLVPGAGHFDPVAPFAPAWREVEAAVLLLLR